jgi:hypothetical protein
MSVGLKGYRLTWDKTPTGIQAIVTDASTRVVLQRDFGHINVEQMASQEAVIWRDVLLKRNPKRMPQCDVTGCTEPCVEGLDVCEAHAEEVYPSEEPSPCPACGGDSGVMGRLGSRTHYMCRDCGAQFSVVDRAEPTGNPRTRTSEVVWAWEGGEWVEHDPAPGEDAGEACDRIEQESGIYCRTGRRGVPPTSAPPEHEIEDVLGSSRFARRGGRMMNPSKPPKYPWYAVDMGSNKIVGGWDFKTDAEMSLEDHPGRTIKVRSRKTLASMGINPDTWADWELTQNPAGLTAKGERMYEHIKAGYGRDPRAKEIAARTVYARSSEGAPGLVKNPDSDDPEVKYGSRRFSEAIHSTRSNEDRNWVFQGMARTLWVAAYMHYVDEERMEGRGKDLPYPRGGENWDDYAPTNPEGAYEAAAKLIEMYEKLNGKAIENLLKDAAKADGGRKLSTPTRALDYAEEFGSDLAMEALGHGVSWFDDHKFFPLKHPFHFEAWTSDGETLEYSGRA